MKQIINSIVSKVLTLAIVALMFMNSTAKASGDFVTSYYNISVNRIGVSGSQYRMSFYNGGSGTTYVTFREVYSNGYGPERVIQLAGHRFATVWVNTPTVEITDTEGAADPVPSTVPHGPIGY